MTDSLRELLAFVRGEKFPPMSPGLRTWKGAPRYAGADGLHRAFLELERIGAVYRDAEDDNHVYWMPVEGWSEPDVAGQALPSV